MLSLSTVPSLSLFTIVLMFVQQCQNRFFSLHSSIHLLTCPNLWTFLSDQKSFMIKQKILVITTILQYTHTLMILVNMYWYVLIGHKICSTVWFNTFRTLPGYLHWLNPLELYYFRYMRDYCCYNLQTLKYRQHIHLRCDVNHIQSGTGLQSQKTLQFTVISQTFL